MKLSFALLLLSLKSARAAATTFTCGSDNPVNCAHSFVNNEGATCCLTNLAYQKPTDQSTTYGGGTSGRAVDGNRDPNWGGGSITHTNAESGRPWWEVDLGEDYMVKYVHLYNRIDCCSDRLSGAVVSLIDKDGLYITNSVFTGDMSGKAEFIAEPSYHSEDLVLTRKVRISSGVPGRILSLAEVEVFGNAPETPSPSLTPTTELPTTVAPTIASTTKPSTTASSTTTPSPTPSPTQLYASCKDDTVDHHLHQGATLLLDSVGLPEDHAPDLVDEIFSMTNEEFEVMEVSDFPTIHLVNGMLEEEESAVEALTFQTQSLSASLSPCQWAVVNVVTSVVSLLLSFVGISGSIAALEGEVIELLGTSGKFLDQVIEAVEGFSTATAWGQAEAIYKVGKLAYQEGLLVRAAKNFVSHLPWWRKLQVGAVALATFGMWFASEGFALVAQIAIAITTLPDLVLSSIEVTHQCIL